MGWLQSAEHQDGIGDGQRPALAIADGPRVGACRCRADDKHAVFEKKAAAAAGRHGFDLQFGRLDAHAGRLGYEGQFIVAAEPGNIGGGVTHIEADHRLALVGCKGGHGISHNSASKSGSKSR